MSTDALELALALHYAPIQRFSLRDRPLPANMDEVLQLASAKQPQLQAAAVRFSESEDTIVEAVRFYLHQVLFESGSDAYRILGLAPNADSKRIREHHIWLQRWLHPDRRGEDWEAALATRINWAWHQLRNESSREEYDRSRQSDIAQDAEDAEDPANVERVQIPAWSAAPINPARLWLRRLVVGGAIALCGALFYLAATRQDRVDPDVLASHSNDVDSEIRTRIPFVDESRHRVPEPVDSAEKAAPVAARIPLQTSANPPSEPSARPDPPVDNSDSIRIKPEPPVGISGNAVAALPVKVAEPPSGNPSTPATSHALAQTAEVEPASLASDQTDMSAGSPRRSPRVESTIASTHAGAPNRATEPASVTPAEAIPAKAADAPHASVKGDASTIASSGTMTAAASAAHGKTGNAIPPVPVEMQAAVEKPVLAQEITQPIPVEADPASTEVPADASRASSPPTLPPDELDRATLARFELARARVRSMVSYFGSEDIVPPNWKDEPGRHSAAREREVLRQRSGELGIDRFVMGPPVWQITHSAVSLKAAYQIVAKRTSAESGRFQLDMVWAGDNWKITHIELSPGT